MLSVSTGSGDNSGEARVYGGRRCKAKAESLRQKDRANISSYRYFFFRVQYLTTNFKNKNLCQVVSLIPL